MGLKQLSIPKHTIKTAGGDFTVSGLSFQQITILVQRHFEALSELFTQAMTNPEGDLGLSEDRIGQVLVSTAPELAAEIIALATGEFDDEAIRIAKGLPFPVQIDAIDKIGALTFSADQDVKKVIAVVTHMLKGTSSALANLRT